ncbi:peptidylprolyl isomerase [Sebaldella sp. S0638]|uniref:peptidylprolyl isomerase n=1 Tax=Sebaldella sp. S0638 TaxID=2957809 RepID=UPI00209D255A|nr:peptidylprolyl isomerase [Sebaldella sp. S0638]MCP1225192.1 peptidylprolyl isomerase [Sebaldella sp. S0638]
MKKALAGLLILLGLVSCTGDSNRVASGDVVYESKDKKVKVFKEEVDFVINQSMDPEMLEQVPKEQLEAQKKAIIKQLAFYKAIALSPEAAKLKATKDYKLALGLQEDTLLTGLFLKDKVKDIKISDEETKKFYDENKAAFTRQDNIADLQLIYLPYRSDEEKAQADKVLAEAKQNKDKFGDLAKQYSADKTSAANGGATGPLPLDKLGANFAPIRDAALNGPVNEVVPSLVVLGGDTAVIVKVNKKELKGEVVKYDDVKKNIAFQLKQKKIGEEQAKIEKEIVDKYDLNSIDQLKLEEAATDKAAAEKK